MDNELNKKYFHLLNPIKYKKYKFNRDLTQNWNIDIANELEEYLESLDKIQFTFDNGNKILNFAEAALLIQV